MTTICTAEISLYPLSQNFLDIIGDFIERIQSYPEFEVVVMTTCTHVRGEHARLFDILGQEILRVHQQTGQAILVCKFLLGDSVGVGLYETRDA
ncbi:YkoF family thiamine/hydroxymethylpyrimidine-binding protein [Alteromonas oceanisediminis]|uniref:YkoF family thiamine/hydroxymethylpyrimidine-binding protein n=1 Tax=Alteromonas oceanisediminis TaxID=2836180 RepID=UPI001BDAED44|nr:YkoF family thiamine/hydroxymethylpyrimidine-binding protein [Alteromonas oceanisediminis]MBT0584847.1 hypothetical protein [Alteromonas oceanisediminis]